MDLGYLGYVILVLAVGFLYFNSFNFQLFFRGQKFKKSFSDEFMKSVKGSFLSKGHFTTGSKVLTNSAFRKLPNREKINFSDCFNVVSFRTPDAKWELFFHLIKEHGRYKQYLSIRCFPHKNWIRSEGNVEMNQGHLNIFANNRYLTGILEKSDAKNQLRDLLRANGDAFLISKNIMHCEIVLSKKPISVQRALDIVKVINSIKNKIYKDNVLEY